MRKPHRFDSVSIPWLRLAVFVGAFLLFLTAWQFVEVELGFAFLAYWTVALILSAGTAWLSGSFVLLDRQSADLQAKLGEANTRLPALEQRLDSLMKLNRAVLDAEDEKSLMDTALGIISDLACADAVTFVPMDEWGQPLSAFTYGDLPEPVLTAPGFTGCAACLWGLYQPLCGSKHALSDSGRPFPPLRSYLLPAAVAR
jgi:hypothetical protein